MSKQKNQKIAKTKEIGKRPEIKYHDNAKVTCACGNTFHTGSTAQEISIEICSVCHPFYTGSQKLVDTAGRVDRFKERMAKVKDINKNNAKSKMQKSK